MYVYVDGTGLIEASTQNDMTTSSSEVDNALSAPSLCMYASDLLGVDVTPDTDLIEAGLNSQAALRLLSPTTAVSSLDDHPIDLRRMCELVADVLGVAVNPDTVLHEAGIYSLAALKLRDELRRAHRIELDSSS